MPGTTIPRDPSTWTLEDARSALQAVSRVTYTSQGVSTSARTAVDAYAKMASAYMAGDHVQNLEQWRGAGYDSAGALSEASKASILRHYASAPEVERIVERRVNGACGNQADISAVPAEPDGATGAPEPTEAEIAAQKRIADAWKRDISEWCDNERWWSGGRAKNSQRGVVQHMVAQGTEHLNGAACLRVFIDPDSLVDGRVPDARNRREALENIHLVAPSPTACAIYADPDTKRETGIFYYKDREDRNAAEVWFRKRGRPSVLGDATSPLTDTGKWYTWLRVLTEGKSKEDAPSEELYVYPWGVIPIFQIEVGNLLNPSILSLQATLDAAITGLSRLITSHAYAQRDEINAKPAGRLSTTPPPVETYGPVDTEVIDGVTYYVWPQDRALGGVVNNINGFPYRTGSDEDGNETLGFTTPQIVYHEPSDPAVVLTGIGGIVALMRDGCAQGHIPSVVGGSTAEASGEAYEQRRAEHLADIKGVAEAVDVGVAEMLRCVTIMADWMVNEAQATAFSDRYRIVAQSHPNAGPVSADAQRVAAELGEKRVLAMATVRARVGVQDVQAEEDAVQAQPLTLKEQVDTASALRDGGADAVASYVKVGMDEETARALARTDGPPFVEQ